VPVLAMGVPTVIYATTIVSEAVDQLLTSIAAPIYPLDAESRRSLIREVLGESMGTLVVTPKEVDVMVESISDILADGLNEALHPGISAQEAAAIR